MALTVTTSSAQVGGAETTYWSLHGHSEEVLCAAAYRQHVCATGGADGLVLVWRFAGSTPEHACRMRTGGPAALDVAWSNATTLLTAQGDGCASVWDVEKGVKTRSISRYAIKGRCAWPVVNCVAATTRGSFVFGGDDGYLVSADTRSDKVSTSVHLNVPVTAATSAEYSLFVGDVCGALHWFDTRVGSKELERIQCGAAGITSVVAVPDQDRIVSYALNGDAQVIDSQPFALSSSDRLVGATNLGDNTRQSLLRGSWLPRAGAVVLPSGSGDVVAISPADIGGGVTRTLHQRVNGPVMNVCAAVGEGVVLCGGGDELAVYSW
ncbi:hypothetical protein ABB37_01480 [Leptomonas pyrrhocoris]|uniref:Uncharacterized protein n=1 Tax=Leptomonas pyrrhocoris TaxID=157538 RepID=A0A0M9G8U0_LEPPY|nr:hypothetical protein ABB37_01480 [Leptomonas pyrrhocoris]KPA85063.1 hypothetical protein ABB37_01480 [Leptomonas pyrrhocoris]|eukprot:XP_015663502.1 hypothetical protein ABB37_01480 [Leptomonas pyrrhocoris]